MCVSGTWQPERAQISPCLPVPADPHNVTLHLLSLTSILTFPGYTVSVTAAEVIVSAACSLGLPSQKRACAVVGVPHLDVVTEGVPVCPVLCGAISRHHFLCCFSGVGQSRALPFLCGLTYTSGSCHLLCAGWLCLEGHVGGVSEK